MVFTKKEFEKSLEYRNKTGSFSKEVTDVSDMLRNRPCKGMEIQFILKSSLDPPRKKAFEGMVSTMTPEPKKIKPTLPDPPNLIL